MNICSQKGLFERFDSTIGAGTCDSCLLAEKASLRPVQAMAALIPVLEAADARTQRL